MSRNTMDGYCVHGVYVGGCGADWMCGWCEDGTVSDADYFAYVQREANRKIRYSTAVTACAAMFSGCFNSLRAEAAPTPMVSKLAASIVTALWKSTGAR